MAEEIARILAARYGAEAVAIAEAQLHSALAASRQIWEAVLAILQG